MREQPDDLTRRSFLKTLGASIALAGLDGCTRIPAEKILPYVSQPPELTPGVAVHYATSMVLDGFATGLVVETHEGRPTKIEGNPDHPASLGAAGVFEQVSLLQLYDPDRATYIRTGKTKSTWQAFAAAMSPASLRTRVGARGAGLAILLEPTSSPMIAECLTRLRAIYPDVRVCYYAPFMATGGEAAFTPTGLIPQYDLRSADVILSVGSDFLASGPFALRYAREFADRRRDPRQGMNRLYVAETGVTVTGGAADHHLSLRPSELGTLLDSVLTAVRGGKATSPWSEAVAEDLKAHAGRSLVIPGPRQPARVHALAAAINDALKNTEQTVWFTQSPLLGAGDASASITSLGDAMRARAVDTLVCLGGNPSYSTPAALQFSTLLRAIPNSVYLGLYENETARDAKWFVPAAHYLETWGDARAYDGTYSIVQPLLQPLHGGKSSADVLLALSGQAAADTRALLKEVAFKNANARSDDEWNQAVGRGFVTSPALARVVASAKADLLIPQESRSAETFDVVIEPDARVHDGSFANNGWLQELPDPITKLTWDNAALVSPSSATRLGVATGDLVEITKGGATIRIPAIVVPGHADNVATLHFGYGRRGSESLANDVGVDVKALWPDAGTFHIADATVARAKRGGHRDLAITQSHWTMEGRGQARTETLASYQNAKAPAKAREPLPIYDPPSRLHAPLQWAMTIDLGTCIGCSACVVACQSENNIPVVGRDDVVKSREMQWLRIDRYVEGSEQNPTVVTQPMLCQQCENAPCEYVCPVGATTHSDDGLNEMVYNRCVGTRFCSNNCPYKVRRFNWFDYNRDLSDTEKMGKNPDVTVRERGVMEKCTFCVQRIREAEIQAGVEGRAPSGNDVKTACQQSCPTNAIVFGSTTEPDSEMMRRRNEPRAYGVLEELDTNPRVRYLARIRNANPRLEQDT